MAQYSGFERKVARFLESMPWLRDLIRHSYKRLIYLVNIPKIKLELSQGVKLIDLAQKCGVKDYDAFFFGYYDKSPWSKDGRYYLGHILRQNSCEICVCDLENNTHQVVARTSAWNYQQGAMTQWLPGEGHLIYNDYHQNNLGAYIYQLTSGEKRFIPFPVQVVHPEKNEYLSLNYRRLAWLRPDYGYFDNCENFQVKQDYEEDGIWKVDIDSGEALLIIKIGDLIAEVSEEFREAAHKVNHCYYSPSGKHFVFLHRWLDKSGKYSRLICSSADGSERRIILDHRMISHYSWINDAELVVWGRTPEYGDAYIVLNALSGKYVKLDQGNLTKYGDGHPTMSSLNMNIITDTYPDKSRMRSLLLYNHQTYSVEKIGYFFSPWKFEGERRCDLHPRWNPNENCLSIDSAHKGKRMNYLVYFS